MKSDNSKRLMQIMKYLKNYRLLTAVSIILAAVTVALTLYVPIVIGEAIDNIVSEGSVDFVRIAALLMRVALVVGATALLQWIMNTINNRITYGVVRDVRNAAFRKIEVLPLKFIDSHSQGDIVSRVIADADQFADGLLMGFTQLFTGVPNLLIIIEHLFYVLR